MRDPKDVLLNRLESLRLFNKNYDDGQEFVAIDIATIIRALCKDTKNTQSLLSQAGLKSKIIFQMYVGIQTFETNILTSHPLCTMRMRAGQGAFMPLLEDVKEIGGVSYQVKFNQWWDQIVIKDSFKNKFSRKDLVETVCDKEGGAHYDSELKQKDHNLFYENSIAWTVISSTDPVAKPFNNKVHLASIRHISYELVSAIEVCLNT